MLTVMFFCRDSHKIFLDFFFFYITTFGVVNPAIRMGMRARTQVHLNSRAIDLPNSRVIRCKVIKIPVVIAGVFPDQLYFVARWSEASCTLHAIPINRILFRAKFLEPIKFHRDRSVRGRKRLLYVCEK